MGLTQPGKSKEQTPRRIGELLVFENLVQPEHVQEALEAQKKEGGKIVELLIKLGHLDVATFSRFIAKQGIASIDLKNYTLSSEVTSLIPQEFAEQYDVLAIDKMGSLLTVGMVCPLDAQTLSKIGEMTGLRVKALLCSMEDIKTAMERAYPSEDEEDEEVDAGRVEAHVASNLRLGSVAELIRQIEELPALPETVKKVKKLVSDPNSSVRQVGEIVGMDPAVSARLLKLANSAAYGFAGKVDNPVMAATLLGLQETYLVVLSAAVFDAMESSKHFDHKAYWESSIYCGTAARAIDAARDNKGRAGLFTAGLLSGIGRFAFAEAAPARYGHVDQNARGLDLIASEERVFGIAHPEAGYILASSWGLPEETANAIRLHRGPDMATDYEETVHTVALAAYLMDRRDREGGVLEAVDDDMEETLKLLGLDADDVRGIREGLQTELAGAEQR